MKRTRSDSLLWLSAALAAAVLCAAARRIQLSTAFEGELRLPLPMAPASVALVVCYAAAALVLLLLARKQSIAPILRDRSPLTLYAREDALFLGGMILSGALCLIAAPTLLVSGGRMWSAYQTARESYRMYGDMIPGGDNGLLTLLTGIVSALSFIAFLVAGKAASRNAKKGRLAILLPAVNNCLWLMAFYRSHAANPVLWDYAPMLAAIAAGVLLYLNWAGLYAGVFAPRRTLWTAGMTVVLSLSALMGEWTLSHALLLASQLAAALVVLWCAPKNLRYPPECAAEAAPAGEKPEEENHE